MVYPIYTVGEINIDTILTMNGILYHLKMEYDK